jgi:hypothetical protein
MKTAKIGSATLEMIYVGAGMIANSSLRATNSMSMWMMTEVVASLRGT